MYIKVAECWCNAAEVREKKIHVAGGSWDLVSGIWFIEIVLI